jgi:hypothetical protein
MKVPELEQDVQVKGALYQGPGPMRVEANDQVGQALGQLGGAADNALNTAEDVNRKAVEKANQMKVAEGLANLEKSTTSRLQGDSTSQGQINAAFDASPQQQIDASFNGGKYDTSGYLSTKGQDAHAKSAEVLDSLIKDRDTIAETLPEAARAEFHMRSQVALESARRQVEQHAATQFEQAKTAASTALSSETVRSVANDYADPLNWVKVGLAVKSARELATSPEQADAAEAKVRADAAKAAIYSAIEHDDIEYAKLRLEIDRKWIGTGTDEVHAAITRAELAQHKQLKSAEDEKTVAEIVATSKNKETGYVDGDAAREKLNAIPEARRSEVRDLLEKQLHVEHEAFVSVRDNYRNAARGAEVDKQQIPAKAYAWLHQNDNEFLLQMQRDQRIENDRWRKLNADDRREAADARREQAAANRLALTTFQALPLEEQVKATVDHWVAGKAVDDQGRMEVAKQQRIAADMVKKGLSTNYNSYVEDVEKDISKALGDKKSKTVPPKNQDQADTWRARAAVQYQQYLDAHGNKPPDTATREKMAADLQREAILNPRTFWFDTKGPAGTVPLTPEEKVVLERTKALSPTAAPTGPTLAPAAPPKPHATPKAADATRAAGMRWLEKNPNDARAAAVRRKLGP